MFVLEISAEIFLRCLKDPTITSLSPGLTWQDDITQQLISRELSKLRIIPLRHQATPPSPLIAYSSSRDRKLRPGQAELSRNLQQYLTGLGFLSQSEAGGQPGVQREGANVQVRVSYTLDLWQLLTLEWIGQV